MLRAFYVNLLGGDEDPDRVREAYGDSVYDRLVDVKATYDPDNVFRYNQNIMTLAEPASANNRARSTCAIQRAIQHERSLTLATQHVIDAAYIPTE